MSDVEFSPFLYVMLREVKRLDGLIEGDYNIVLT